VDDDEVDSRRYAYYDPIDTLPEPGQRWWRKQVAETDTALAATVAS
jgi:lysine 2,3-aminomutase